MPESPSVETLDAKVNNLESQFHDLDSKFTDGFNQINTRLDRQAHDSATSERNILAAMDARFDRTQESADRNRPSLMNILLVAAGMGGIVLTIVGGFGSAKLDPITERINEHTAQLEHVRETTESRDELAARFMLVDNKSEENKRQITLLARKDVVEEIVRDINERLRMISSRLDKVDGELVSRAEHKEHWDETTNRINVLAEGIRELRKEDGGASLSEQLKSLQTEMQALEQKFVVGPPFFQNQPLGGAK